MTLFSYVKIIDIYPLYTLTLIPGGTKKIPLHYSIYKFCYWSP